MTRAVLVIGADSVKSYISVVLGKASSVGLTEDTIYRMTSNTHLIDDGHTSLLSNLERTHGLHDERGLFVSPLRLIPSIHSECVPTDGVVVWARLVDSTSSETEVAEK